MPAQGLLHRTIGLLTASLVALVLGVACAPRAPGGSALPPQAVALGESGLWVSAPSLRAMPAMAMGAAYFTVHNRSGHNDHLLAVSVAAPSPGVEASLHETLLEDGVSRMRSREDGFSLRDGEDLVLAPGGAHVMLSGALPEPPLQLTVRFERAGPFTVTVPSAGP